MDVNQQLIRPYLYSVSVMVLFLLPLVSMRLVSEEKRQGTLEILLTTPAPDGGDLVGKYLASVALFGGDAGRRRSTWPSCSCSGPRSGGRCWTGFLGLFLTGAAYLALGLFLSSVTQNQVVAAAAAFALFLGLWLMHWLGG